MSLNTAAPGAPEEMEKAEEIEVKYLVDPDKFPEDLRTALMEGSDHPGIVEKGRITQLYLPVTKEILKMAVEAIQAVPLTEVSDEDTEFFLDPENVTEVRILQRENSFVSASKRSSFDQVVDMQSSSTRDPDAFQITIKGKANADGTRRRNIESPITTNLRVSSGVVDLLEHLNDGESMAWRKKVKTVEKMWYDLKIDHPEHPGEAEKQLLVELDIFPDISYLALAEVEFEDEEELSKLRDKLPEWFAEDVTDDPALKVRNLADLSQLEEIDSTTIREGIEQIRNRLAVVYQSTALGDALGELQPELIKDLRFVLLGSFKKWLPQFRRISQDLSRRSAGVYPLISTLDIARRQIQNNRRDTAFRIEAEETQPLEEAERAYLDKIAEADAVYLIAPEGRVGRSSGQEAAYAVSRDRKLFVSNVVDRVAADLPGELRILMSAMIRDLMSGEERSLVQRRDLTPAIRAWVERTIKNEAGSFDAEFMLAMMKANRDNLLGNAVVEDANRAQVVDAEAGIVSN